MSSRRRRLQALLYALPVLAVAVVGIAVLGPGADRPYRAARVYAGPTQGVESLPMHVVVVDRIGEVEVGVAGHEVDVSLRVGADKVLHKRVTTDARGHAWPTFALPKHAGALKVSVQDGGRDIGSARVDLSRSAWLAKARGRGGFLKGKRAGTLRVDVSPARGVLAVPFPDHLVVQVSEASRAVAGARVTLSKEDGGSQKPVTTDAHGRAQLPYLALEHALSVKVVATAEEGRSGWFWGALPVVPGALDARLTEAGIRLESAILRDVAYVALLTQAGRLDHAAITLEPDGRGGAVGLGKIKPPKQQPRWWMGSSESDFNA
ncbi:MAG TPA: carboxypeptidase-like regulatory domain-containing protein, partial [Polyangiaceae bacterium]|nr:carboxypeptidase-like regulatory domain-containing protein [Polyangiaceae bacterium]